MLAWELKQMQSLPLEIKIIKTQQRIREWYEAWDGDVYVSFSGGKDSTVLLKLVRELYPDVPGVFVDTGLEFPEIRSFVKKFENITWIKPKIPFFEVVEKYGYPVISKEQSQSIHEIRNCKDKSGSNYNKRMYGDKNGRYKVSEKWKFLIDAPFKVSHMCCHYMKKEPAKRYEKETGRVPFLGIMAEESRLRKGEYLQHGCNSFNTKRPKSSPMGFWTEQDVLLYLMRYKEPYATVYGDLIEYRKMIYTTGQKRTGCMFCMYGIHLDKGENNFQRMAKTHPKQYDYCINKMGLGEVLDYIGVDYRVNSLFEGVEKI